MIEADDLLMPVLSAADARAEEERAFRSSGVQERVVLESAGRALALAVAENVPEGRVVGIIGRGNNGRDTLVALRTLRAWGRDVAAITVGDAASAADVLHGWSLPTSDSLSGLETAAVVLDGLLGTGASGGPRPEMHPAITAVNATSAPVVAVDGPSGVDLTTGTVASVAVKAQLTVTFGSLKRGLLLHPGRQFAGRILVAEIGLPPLSVALQSVAHVITDAWARANLPYIAPDAYKNRVGIVTIVAGRQGMGGAPIMAAMGALRAGAGGVRIISSESNRSAIHAAVPEGVFHDRESPNWLDALSGSASVVAGPGMGADEAGSALLDELVTAFPGPIVLDADALTIMGQRKASLPEMNPGRFVMTPHPGELARLLGTTSAEILSDRFGAAERSSAELGCTVLSKGAPTLVASDGHSTLVSLSGHSGVATGGMGDTLAGIVGSLLAAGAAPRTAAALAVHYAGRAAEASGRGRGLLPRDVAEALPHVLRRAPVAAHHHPFLLDLPPAA